MGTRRYRLCRCDLFAAIPVDLSRIGMNGNAGTNREPPGAVRDETGGQRAEALTGTSPGGLVVD
jgi:hypothetical protein